MTKNIMIVGVGGQGTLLASKILGHVLLSQNFDVKRRKGLRGSRYEPARRKRCDLCKIRR